MTAARIGYRFRLTKRDARLGEAIREVDLQSESKSKARTDQHVRPKRTRRYENDRRTTSGGLMAFTSTMIAV
jgi:hypothetical protein